MKQTSTTIILRAAMTLLVMVLVGTAGYGKKITLSDGNVLEGNIKKATVNIKSGATVTFSNLYNKTKKNCVVCEGDATIILEGSNRLTCKKSGFPAIYVPNGATLTIQGNGSLDVVGGKHAAGIGGKKGKKCGNIVINGGVITAKAKTYGAGIGSGYKGTCGTITIGIGITSINATGGKNANGVGAGYKGSCGTITLAQGLKKSQSSTNCLITPSAYVTTDGTLTSTTETIILNEGAVLTGTGGENTHVSIASGATVMLDNVDITAISNNSDHQWAGITCLGDANIVLTGTNQVKGGYESAGISVPSGHTLTISGSGTLTATGRDGSAGIGSNKDTECGNIVIEDGTVNAIGGDNGAGIGGLCTANSEEENATGGVVEEEDDEDDEDGDDDVFDDNDDVETGVFSSNIAIMGGTVTATGGSGAAGIGGSYDKNCSTATIEITGGIVVALGGSGAAGIGSGNGSNASWGKIGIDGRIISVTATPGQGCSNAIISGTLLKPTGMTDVSTGSTRTLSNPKWTGSGTENDPYIIKTPQDLNLLAYRVNYSEGDYPEKYYKLDNDITYPNVMIYDYDQDGVRESNFECIGYYDDDDLYMAFRGHFDGAGYTISGIRLHRKGPGGDGDPSDYQGLFGWILNGEVKNLRLRDVQITGHEAVGGIAGCLTTAKVSDCYVGNDVIVDAVTDMANSHGGIAGFVTSGGVIEGCVSAATVSNKKTSQYSQYFRYGGIAGENDGELRNNLVLGANIHTTADDDSYGAIVGDENRYATMKNNYYSGCTVGDGNSGGVGHYYDGSTTSYFIDFTNNDGAVPALRNDASNSNAQSLLAALPANLDLGWGVGKYPLSLAGRTLYKDGYWNTLCLPFAVGDATAEAGHHFDGTPLVDATVMELIGTTSNLTDGTLTLNFTDASAIEAGKPYIIKWAKADGYDQASEDTRDLKDPVFTGVTINNNASTEVSFSGGKFKGTYEPIEWDTENKSILFLGVNDNKNKLYYPESGAGVKAFRAYFKIGDDTSPAPQITAINLNFDGETTGVTPLLSPEGEEGASPRGGLVGVWYTLSGTRLSAQPTKKGLYINSGRKVVIK